MNEARKALIKIQTAPPGIPVGRFHPQLAIIADFLDNLVNLKIENNSLHAQVLEAHERFSKLLGDMATPPASKPDQAQSAAVIRACEDLRMPVLFQKPYDPYFDAAMLHGVRPKAVIMDDYFNTVLPEFTATTGPKIDYAKVDISSAEQYIRANHGVPDGWEMNSLFTRTYREFLAAGWTEEQMKNHFVLRPIIKPEQIGAGGAAPGSKMISATGGGSGPISTADGGSK